VTTKRASLKTTKEKNGKVSEKAAVSAKRPAAMASQPAACIEARTGRDRRAGDRRHGELPVAIERRQGERRIKVNRRRQIDPTTCERDYTPDEIEFMAALDEYKRRSGRMFPTCSEVLEVFKGLNYVKQPPLAAAEAAPAPVGN
jgi:hypothetical protein